MLYRSLMAFVASLHLALIAVHAAPPESLDRGVVAMRTDDGVFVSWRLLGNEPGDTAFNVYRSQNEEKPVCVNDKPLAGPTHLLDASRDASKGAVYLVRPVRDGKEGDASRPFTVEANADVRPFLTIPLKTPEGYAPNDASVGDLDGDGQYEIILHQTGRAHDNSHSGLTDPPIFQAYRLDGELLWEINLGRNVREGAHYTQFMVYDLDGDGRAEMVCRTADGSTDGKGKVIGDADADFRNPDGRILSGPEYLTVFDGRTGAALATTDYIPQRHPETHSPTGEQMKAVWGDGYGNRSDRFLACVAYLDGEHPSVVMCRGYYTRSVLAAWDWRDGKLTHRWTFDSSAGSERNRRFAGQGNHNLSVGDVDGDGKDEIVYGGMAIDDDGTGLYTTGLGHGDAMHLTDLDPDHPGQEVFRIQEPFGDAGVHMFDAATGGILWKHASIKAGDDGEGPGRGLALDVDPRFPGAECWAAGAGLNRMFTAKGKLITKKGTDGKEEPVRTPSVNMGVWWDGDALRELLDGTHIDKWNWRTYEMDRLLSAEKFDCVSNNGTKANPVLAADILGDWREEVIWRTKDNDELRVFVSTIPTELRMPTLMHDRQYRLGVAWQNVAYNQPPHLSFSMDAAASRSTASAESGQ